MKNKKFKTQFDEISEQLKSSGKIVLSPERYREAFEVVREYYKDDALMKWLAGDCDSGFIAEKLFKVAVELSKESLVYFDSEEKNAIAIWFSADVSLFNISKVLNSGGRELIKAGGMSFLKRILKYELYANKLKHKYSGKNCWHLFVFAMKDSVAGRHLYTSPMLDSVARYCWERNIPCYTEVNTVQDIVELKQAGFQIREWGAIPGTDVSHFALIL